MILYKVISYKVISYKVILWRNKENKWKEYAPYVIACTCAHPYRYKENEKRKRRCKLVSTLYQLPIFISISHRLLRTGLVISTEEKTNSTATAAADAGGYLV